MENVRNPREATDASPQKFREETGDDGAVRDDCTLPFNGRMNVSDEERGSDPYNRTGRFQRLVR